MNKAKCSCKWSGLMPIPTNMDIDTGERTCGLCHGKITPSIIREINKRRRKFLEEDE